MRVKLDSCKIANELKASRKLRLNFSSWLDEELTKETGKTTKLRGLRTLCESNRAHYYFPDIPCGQLGSRVVWSCVEQGGEVPLRTHKESNEEYLKEATPLC